MAPGVRLEDVKRVSGEAAALLAKRPEVAQVFEAIGGDDEVRFATLNINLVPRDKRKLSTVEFERDMAPTLRQLPDARVNFQSQTGGVGGHDVTVMLVGDDPLLLHKSGEQLVKGMVGLPMLRDAHIDADLQRPEIVIRPHFDLAASMGVSVAALSQTIRIATIGDVPQNLAKFSLSDRQIPIRVQLPESARGDLDTLRNLPVPTANGSSVPLKVLAGHRLRRGRGEDPPLQTRAAASLSSPTSRPVPRAGMRRRRSTNCPRTRACRRASRKSRSARPSGWAS